jgi:hypothetical protein
MTALDWSPGDHTKDIAPWFVGAMPTYFGRSEVDVVASPPPAD